MVSTIQGSGAGGSIVGGTGSSSPIRGRDEQLDVITGFLERVRAGVGGVAVIEGAAGLGKTRLLAAARATAHGLSFRTGLGAAEPGHSSVELAVLMEALFGGAESPIERTALGSHDGSREEPFWLLQDLETLMERAALRQPLLVCLDDVQWADAGCGFALRMLTQWLASLPVAWLIAVRPDQGAPQIRRALAELTTAGAATIRLTPLAASAVAEVAADVLGAPAGGDLLRTLAGVQGNPFLIVDLLAGLREENLVRLVDGRARLAENRVPHRLEDSMRRRLARTTPAGERVVAQPDRGDGPYPHRRPRRSGSGSHRRRDLRRCRRSSRVPARPGPGGGPQRRTRRGPPGP